MKDATSVTSVSISTLTRSRSRAKLSRTATQNTILSGRNCFEVSDFNMAESRDCRRVKVLYTGGTIGMVRNSQGVLAPIPNEFEKKLRRNPQMHDGEYSKALFGVSSEMAPLVLPDVPGMKRIVYSIYEYETLLDSSNMTMDDWSRIANDIRQIYELFDGFVILHGTDTLPYTASALSFMLENLGKTVIVTGAQIPIFEVRSDGVDNLLSSLILAGNYVIPEVTVYFNYRLLRGNRTVKISSGSFKAFDSPNFPPLGKVGLKVEVQYREIFRPTTLEKFYVHSNLNKNVGLLRIFPSISTQTVEAFLQPPMEGAVLQTYGAGNIPSNRDDLTNVFYKAAQRGVILINCTQCAKGTVVELYQTGKDLYDAGVLPGFDMTPEAALAKLAYVLSKDEWDMDYKRSIMQSNIRGELTGVKPAFQQEFDLVDAIAKSLLITCHEFGEMDTILFPAMLCSAVDERDVTKIAELKRYGANMSATNPDLRTPLHIACSNGDLEVVQYLLLSGASVHMRDRYDQTPLLDAIQAGHEQVIKLLRQCGAHLHLSPGEIGEKLCSAATHGDNSLLNSFLIGGANLSQTDHAQRSALHAAVLHNQVETVEYLLSKKVVKDMPDSLGFTPLDIAEKLDLSPIIELLKETEQSNTVIKQVNGLATSNEESKTETNT